MNSYRRILVSSKDSPDGEPTAVEVGPIAAVEAAEYKVRLVQKGYME